jgi:outer membrane protein TolC
VRAGAPHRWLGLGALFLAWVCAEAAAQTIDDAMVGAYQTNPQLLSARAQLRALDEGVPAAQVQAFEAQVRAYQVAFNSIEQEQRVGTRTVVDVLNAQQDLFTAQVNLVASQRDVTVYGYQLASSVGRLTAAELALPIEIYDPVRYYRDARGKWFGTSIGDGDGRASVTDKHSEGGAK